MLSDREPREWLGKAYLSDDVWIMSYTPSKKFDLEVEKSKTVAFISTNNQIMEKLVDCLKVNSILIKTPELEAYEAEKFVKEQAQIVADYLGFLNNKFILAEILELKSLKSEHFRSYSKGYNYLETNSAHIPQKVDLPLLENLNEDTITQLSNYNYGTQNNTFARFTGSYKVIEIENPKDESILKLKSARAVLSHGKADVDNTMKEAKTIFDRLSFRPTYRTDREKIISYARALQTSAQKLLEDKLNIEWVTNEKLYSLKED